MVKYGIIQKCLERNCLSTTKYAKTNDLLLSKEAWIGEIVPSGSIRTRDDLLILLRNKRSVSRTVHKCHDFNPLVIVVLRNVIDIHRLLAIGKLFSKLSANFLTPLVIESNEEARIRLYHRECLLGILNVLWFTSGFE